MGSRAAALHKKIGGAWGGIGQARHAWHEQLGPHDVSTLHEMHTMLGYGCRRLGCECARRRRG